MGRAARVQRTVDAPSGGIQALRRARAVGCVPRPQPPPPPRAAALIFFPTPRRTPPVKSFVSVLNKSLINSSKQAAAPRRRPRRAKTNFRFRGCRSGRVRAGEGHKRVEHWRVEARATMVRRPCPRPERSAKGARARAVAQTDPYLFFAHKYSTHIPARRKPTRTPGLLPLPSHFCRHQLLKRRLERPAGRRDNNAASGGSAQGYMLCGQAGMRAWTSALSVAAVRASPESSEKLEQCLRRPGQGGSRRRDRGSWHCAHQLALSSSVVGRPLGGLRDRTAT